MMKLIVVLLAVLVCSAVGATTWQRIESASALPLSWAPEHETRPSGRVHLAIALTRRNTQRVHEILAQVSDPQSPRYGEYLSRDAVEALVAPPRAAISAVRAWAAAHGARNARLSGYSDLLEVDVDVEAAERMLNTRFLTLRHRASGVRVARAVGSYYAPTEVARHIDYIAGVQGLPLLEPRGAPTPPGDSAAFGPATLRSVYGVSALGGKSANNSMAVAEFQAQFYSPNDLKMFWQSEVDYAPLPSGIKVVGDNQPNDPGAEASLDIQYILGVAPKVPAQFWSQASFDFWTDLTTFAADVARDQNPPLVFSVSYGSQSQYPSVSIRERLNTDFAAMGTRGISVIFASGDYGTGCFLCAEFVDSVPATLPSVTSVGATTFATGTNGTEIAVNAFKSGGGFSSHFTRQAWQASVVEKYLSSGVSLPASFFYNRNGRGNPDVAALGWGFTIFQNGQKSVIGGTSASAPTFSAVVALLNDERLAAGKPPMGYLNPWLYQTAAANPNAFTDITSGNNQQGCCVEGFECSHGWDPVTGLGTPNMAELLKHI